MTKTGDGTLTAGGNSSFSQGAVVSVSGGALALTGFVSVPTGVVLAASGTGEIRYSGTSFSSAFLQGGTHTVQAGGAAFGQTTAFNGTALNVNGPATLTNVTSGAAVNVAAGQTLAWNYGSQTAAGNLLVGGTANVTGFESIGQITVAAGGVLNNTGTDLVLGGGSRTFVGSVAGPGGTIDLGGQTLLLAGGLLVNNGPGTSASGGGVRNGAVVVDFGGRAKGTGYYADVVTRNGGVFSPGNSPGGVGAGTARFNPGGVLNIDVNAAGPNGTPPGGAAGGTTGWGRVSVDGFFRFYPTAGEHFAVTLTSLTPSNQAGQVFNFDPTKGHTWEVVRLLPGAVFTTGETGTAPADPSAYDPSRVDVLTAGTFLNDLQGGTFSTSFEVNEIGTRSVYVNFTPAPEPGTVLGLAAAGLAAAGWVRRRRVGRA